MTSETDEEIQSNSQLTEEEAPPANKTELSMPRDFDEQTDTDASGYNEKAANSDEPTALNGSEGGLEIEESISTADDQWERSGSRTPPTCPECFKTFPSHKSLYGHLRLHPDRDYRGANPPAKGPSPDQPSPSFPSWGAKGIRGRSDVVLTAAETLVLMRMSQTSPVKADESVSESARKSGSSSPAAKTYQCSTCYKTFSTYQALGGHRAGHNKRRNSLEGDRALEGAAENIGAVQAAGSDRAAVGLASTGEHRCRICNETFATGQGLGGHMRRHSNVAPSSGSSDESVTGDRNHVAENARVNENDQQAGEIVRNENRDPIPFDLNESPPRSEEGQRS